MNRYKILAQFPTRQRTSKFFEVLDQYRSKASEETPVTFHAVIDRDDTCMNTPLAIGEMEKRGCKYTISNTSGKINAINTLPQNMDWDILLLLSDDMIPQIRGWNNQISTWISENYPDTDGVLWMNDGFTGSRLNTIVCMGKKYFNRFGYIYHPAYKSLWSDNEFMDVAQSLGRQTYFPQCIIKHEHPANMRMEMDDLYKKNESLFNEDKAVYENRKRLGFPR